MRRYPIEPLLELSRLPYSRIVGRVNSEAWNAMRTTGLTPYMADKLAVKCGFHPSQVWPSWEADEFAELSAPCGECGEQFIPRRKGHVYCAKTCGDRARKRRQYHSDPAHREAKIAAAAANREANREAAAKTAAAWRRNNPERVRAARAAYRARLRAAA